MLKDFLWEAFESTGNIEAYIFYKEIETSDEDELESSEEVALEETLEVVT